MRAGLIRPSGQPASIQAMRAVWQKQVRPAANLIATRRTLLLWMRPDIYLDLAEGPSDPKHEAIADTAGICGTFASPSVSQLDSRGRCEAS
jgi:hypothetical protein